VEQHFGKITKLEAEACKILVKRYGETVGRQKSANFLRNCHRDKAFLDSLEEVQPKKKAA